MSLFLTKLKNKLKIVIPDSLYIRYEYFKLHRRFYSKQHINSVSDRIFSWKLSNELAEFSIFVDKYKVRAFVTQQCGDGYLPELHKVCRVAEEFDLAKMPHKFVLKLNNGSGYNLVIHNKDEHNTADIRHIITQWLESDFYAISKEKQYKNVEQLVLCEEYIESIKALKDYKFYCIDGSIEFIQVISHNAHNQKVHNYYSQFWQPLAIQRDGYDTGKFEPKPAKLDEAIALVEALSQPFSFVRVDLYLQDKIYFGELTFTPGNGYIKYLPEIFDYSLAKKMRLKIKKTTLSST
ncbi:ATP-grasp fold amidoligase family protein [Pseudoalteromonas sp.]|uniref:ATP-grasp fold amidoligase family protein n=1 Tax=Pseudoalteromonas sp. TaxID=53249 RepID=UPI00356813DF